MTRESGCEEVIADLLDLDEIEHELLVRKVEGISSHSEKRRALQNIMAAVSDPANAVCEAVIATLNPDLEYATCADKLEQIRLERQEAPWDEHVSRRSKSRLLLLRMRARRNGSHDAAGGGRFDKIVEEIDRMLHRGEMPMEATSVFDRDLGGLSLWEAREQTNEEEETTSPSRRVNFRPSPLGPISSNSELRQKSPSDRGERNGVPRVLLDNLTQYQQAQEFISDRNRLSVTQGAIPKVTRPQSDQTEDDQRQVADRSYLDLWQPSPSRQITSSTACPEQSQLAQTSLNTTTSYRCESGHVARETSNSSAANNLFPARNNNGPLEESCHQPNVPTNHGTGGLGENGVTPRSHRHPNDEDVQSWRSNVGRNRSRNVDAVLELSRGEARNYQAGNSRDIHDVWAGNRPEERENRAENGQYSQSNRAVLGPDIRRIWAENGSNSYINRADFGPEVQRSWAGNGLNPDTNWAVNGPQRSSHRENLERQTLDEYQRDEIEQHRQRYYQYPPRRPDTSSWDAQHSRSRFEQTVARLDQSLPIERPISRYDQRYQRHEPQIQIPEMAYPRDSHPSRRVEAQFPRHYQAPSTFPRSFHDNQSHRFLPMAKWNIEKFDGTEENLARFLSEVRDFAHSENATKDDLFRGKIHLFTGDAADFIRRSRRIRNWDQLEAELTSYCMGSTSDADLLLLIQSKRQGSESCARFCTRMESLFDALQYPIQPQAMVDIITRGMRPEISDALSGNHFIRNVDELRMAAQKVERIKLHGNGRNTFGVEAVMAPEHQKRGERGEKKVESENSEGKTRSDAPRQEGLKRCYRCGNVGHTRIGCTSPPACYICGKEGVTSTKCPRCSGNANRRSH